MKEIDDVQIAEKEIEAKISGTFHAFSYAGK